MGERRSRTVTRVLLPIVGAALLSGCGGAVLNGLYLLETPRRAFVIQTFDRYEEQRWSYGPSEKDPDLRDGFFISYNGPNYAVTNDLYPGNVEVILAWQLWEADTPGIEDNGHDYDFRIVLDTNDSLGPDPRGPVVELKLFASDSTHTLRVGEGDDPAASGTLTVDDPATETNRGTLRVVFRLNSETPTITARVLDELGEPFLQATHEVPEGWAHNVRFFVEAVGGDFEPRVIDSVLALSPEVEILGSPGSTKSATGRLR